MCLRTYRRHDLHPENLHYQMCQRTCHLVWSDRVDLQGGEFDSLYDEAEISDFEPRGMLDDQNRPILQSAMQAIICQLGRDFQA